MSQASRSKPLKQAIWKVAQDASRRQNTAAFKLYKAIVTEAPDQTTCVGKIRFAGESSQLKIKFVNNTKSSAVGDSVWVATVFDSLRNAVVWAKKDLSIVDESNGEAVVTLENNTSTII